MSRVRVKSAKHAQALAPPGASLKHNE